MDCPNCNRLRDVRDDNKRRLAELNTELRDKRFEIADLKAKVSSLETQLLAKKVSQKQLY